MADAVANVLAGDPRFKALAALSERLSDLDRTVLLVYLVDLVTPEALPHLAEQFHVMGLEGWAAADTEDARRQLIKRAIELHRYKGTPWAVREVLRAVGYADADIEEGLPALRHDGLVDYSGAERHAGGNRWALFRVVVDIGEHKGVGGDELSRLLGMIDHVKPARAQLRDLGYRTSVFDDVLLDESLDLAVHPSMGDVYPLGRRYDGGIRYDQAKPLPRAPQGYDGTAMHSPAISYDGLAPQTWLNDGERYDNRIDELGVDLHVALDEQCRSRRLYDGRSAYEGAVAFGVEVSSCALDRLDLTITHRRRYGGRLSYDGQHKYAGSMPENFSA